MGNYKKGYSEKDVQDVLAELTDTYGADNPIIQEFIDSMLDSTLSQKLETTHEMVPIEKFMSDDYFCGSIFKELWPKSKQSIKDIIDGNYNEAILTGSTGRSKCFAKNTKVVMFDGTVKNIQDIAVGELVMSPDSTSRLVTNTANGKEEMFLVKQLGGEDYTINRSHILSLKCTSDRGLIYKKDEIHNISVSEYLNSTQTYKHMMKGWRPDNIDFPEKELEYFDPYLYGVWLGDGETLGTRVTTMDDEVVDHMQGWCDDNNHLLSEHKIPNNKSNTYSIAGNLDEYNKREINQFRHFLINNNLLGNKHITHDFKTAPRNIRLELLAGILDTDGCQHSDGNAFSISQKSKELSDDISFLARSLGFRVTRATFFMNGTTVCEPDHENATTYYRMGISGNTDQIPFKVSRRIPTKRKQKKNVNRWGITLESQGIGDYYGITLEGKDRLFLLDDFTVVHNTTRAVIVTAYTLYQLSCYDNPQNKLGLMDNSEITIIMLNKTDTLAKNVTYKKFRNLIGRIPYFKEQFKFDKRIESRMVFPNDIVVEYSASTDDRILGKDVISGIMDEVNFLDIIAQSKRATGGGEYDQAVTTYNGLTRRIKSRFLGREDITGCLSVVSSRSYKDDFIGRRMDEIKKDLELPANSPLHIAAKATYIDTGSQWDMQPQVNDDGTVRYCGEKFKFAIANATLDCEILDGGKKALGREVIEVPIENYNEFSKDPIGSLKDIAGMVIENTGKFMQIKPIFESTIHFSSGLYPRIFADGLEEWDLTRGLPPFNENYKLYNNFSNRFVHFDLSTTGDRLGIAIGHSPENVELGRGINQKGYEQEQVINYLVDDCLAIKPPKKGQIKFAEVRKILYHMRFKMRIPIKWVSLDGFQSVDFMQIIEDRGFITKRISTEGEKPYTALRVAFNEGRVIMPHNSLVIDELTNLVQDPKTGRVDHTALSTNDVGDAVSGVYQNILLRHSEGTLYKVDSNLVSTYLYAVPN